MKTDPRRGRGCPCPAIGRQIGTAAAASRRAMSAGPASDVDLLVKFDRPIGLLHLSATALRLEGLLARPVDLVLRRALRPELRARVARRGG